MINSILLGIKLNRTCQVTTGISICSPQKQRSKSVASVNRKSRVKRAALSGVGYDAVGWSRPTGPDRRTGCAAPVLRLTNLCGGSNIVASVTARAPDRCHRTREGIPKRQGIGLDP